MENNVIAGLHHLTAIVGDPQENFDFIPTYWGNPRWLEAQRSQIEKVLLPLHVPAENAGYSKHE